MASNAASRYPIHQVLKADGSLVAKGEEPMIRDAELKSVYATMVKVRALNERGMNLQRQGRINFYIGSEGQEAVHVGAGAALKSEDPYFPHYRDPGVAILRGATMTDIVHQLYGTSKDLVKGRQMPNHFSFKAQEFFSISSPLTTQVPQAVGAAYAIKLKREPRVVMTSFGDGSTSQGDFHVGLNFAGVWKVPCVFLCNNNQYAISVPVEKQHAAETFAQKAEAYGFEGVRCDGNDVLAVYMTSKAAVDKARHGGGPTLVEAVTFRMGPHSSSDDPKRYVPPARLEEWKSRDPIHRLRLYMEKIGVWNQHAEDDLYAGIKAEIQAAVEDAEKTPMPDLATMFEDVYATVPWHLEAQLKELKEVD